eukprot:scaffold10347_cov32-Tisochrysis_lutea.AAC.2
MAITSASDDTLFTCAVAPHQVYGPRDNLFLPNILEAGGTGRLRIFGNGQNRICFTHIDNYAHGLIIAEQALYKGSPANGKFYIVTDGDTHPHPQGYARLWETIDEACVAMGFTSLWEKMKLPLPLLVVLAYIAEFIGWMIGTTMKLNRFNVKVSCHQGRCHVRGPVASCMWCAEVFKVHLSGSRAGVDNAPMVYHRRCEKGPEV